MTTSILQSLPQGVKGELLTSQGSSVSVAYADSQFDDIQSKKSASSTLRVIKDGKLAVATSSKPNDEATLRENALEIAKFGTVIDHEFPGQADYAELDLVDDAVRAIDTKTMVEIAKDMITAITDYDPRIKAAADVTKTEQSVSLTNTAGFSGSYGKTGWSYYLGGQLVQGDDMLWLGEWVSGCDLRDNYEATKADVIKRFELAKTIVPFAAGSYPVIFAPGQVGYLVAPFLASLNGKAIMRDISPWKGKRGQQLLDKRITLIDDGTLPLHVSSVPFDREGVPTRRNTLIKQGVIQQEILDLQSGQALGLPSTGNGTLHGPNPHHVILSAGRQSIDAIRKNIDRGLIIFDTMGAWAGNPFGGNVSGTISLGLLIENGEIIGRVKDCMFSINTFKHFKDHLIATSLETKEDGRSTFPYVALDEVVISTQ